MLDRDSAIEDAGQQLRGIGLKAHNYSVDVSQPPEVASVVDAIRRDCNALPSILVNNAGIIRRGTIFDLDYEEWKAVLDVNVTGAFVCCKQLLPSMLENGGGRIVNVTSVAGKMGDITAAPAYGTSKGALNVLTLSLARQLAQHNILVNAVAPHAIETEMSAEWDAAKRAAIVDAIPLKRLGRPQEVAEAVLFLVSSKAAFITGEILDINGGYLMD